MASVPLGVTLFERSLARAEQDRALATQQRQQSDAQAMENTTRLAEAAMKYGYHEDTQAEGRTKLHANLQNKLAKSEQDLGELKLKYELMGQLEGVKGEIKEGLLGTRHGYKMTEMDDQQASLKALSDARNEVTRYGVDQNNKVRLTIAAMKEKLGRDNLALRQSKLSFEQTADAAETFKLIAGGANKRFSGGMGGAKHAKAAQDAELLAGEITAGNLTQEEALEIYKDAYPAEKIAMPPAGAPRPAQAPRPGASTSVTGSTTSMSGATSAPVNDPIKDAIRQAVLNKLGQ